MSRLTSTGGIPPLSQTPLNNDQLSLLCQDAQKHAQVLFLFRLTGFLVSYGSAKANFEVLCAAGSSGALSLFFLLKTLEREQ